MGQQGVGEHHEWCYQPHSCQGSKGALSTNRPGVSFLLAKSPVPDNWQAYYE